MLPDTRKSPPSWKVQAHTACECSVYVATHLLLEKLHSFTVPSPEAVAKCEPLKNVIYNSENRL
jgi:hypothetical protein